MGGVVVEGYSGEVGVGKLVVSHIRAVNLELEFVTGGAQHRDGRRITRGEVLDGVVEVQLLNFGVGGHRLLNLGHDHVLGLGGEHLTFLGIQVGVVRIDLPLARSGFGTPRDTKLNIVVLERNEGKRRLPVLTKGETEGVELDRAGTIVETGGDRLGRRVR